MTEILDTANEYVNKLETDHVNDLYADIEYWNNKADKCGCPQCKRSAIGAQNRFWEEVERLKEVPQFDSEEFLLYLLALDKLDFLMSGKDEDKEDE